MPRTLEKDLSVADHGHLDLPASFEIDFPRDWTPERIMGSVKRNLSNPAARTLFLIDANVVVDPPGHKNSVAGDHAEDKRDRICELVDVGNLIDPEPKREEVEPEKN